MEAGKDAQNVNAPPDVIRGCDSHKSNIVGVHWLRISFDYKDLQKVKEWVSQFYSENDSDGYGLWSYDSRIIWASGASLNYDKDAERCKKVHKGRITLDLPGRACDELTAPDLLLFIEGAFAFGGKCTRIDIFFDDYKRIVEVTTLQELARQGDFTNFISWHIKESGYRADGKRGKRGENGKRTKQRKAGLTYSEVAFGCRGSKGSGLYQRVYDKLLESDGEQNCIRWENEYSQKKAHKVFTMLAACDGRLDAFVTICGSLIAGSISFVKRTSEKNLGRLEVYEFWEKITKILGDEISVRVKKKVNTLTGIVDWTKVQVAPSLACVRKTFISDEKFYAWIMELTDEGDGRMNANQRNIVERYAGSMNFVDGKNQQQQENEYVNAICKIY